MRAKGCGYLYGPLLLSTKTHSKLGENEEMALGVANLKSLSLVFSSFWHLFRCQLKPRRVSQTPFQLRSCAAIPLDSLHHSMNVTTHTWQPQRRLVSAKYTRMLWGRGIKKSIRVRNCFNIIINFFDIGSFKMTEETNQTNPAESLLGRGVGLQQHTPPQTATETLIGNNSSTTADGDRATEGKNIVLFLDGTSNEFGKNPATNVLKLFQMTLMDRPSQVCYYQPGIGARFEVESEDNFLTNMIDEAIATSLSRHVVAAYNYIVSQYEVGDRIYLFGFSRGSFTCRVLAGMIAQVGLMYRGLEHLTQQAWEYYSNWEMALEPILAEDPSTLFLAFKETFSRDKVPIYFMGLFDSVNSVGLLRDKEFPYVIHCSNVKHIRHAVSLDERRGKFKPVFIKNPDINDPHEVRPETSTNALESFKEILFPGNHGDVGGSWKADTELKDGASTSGEPWERKFRYLSDVLMRWLLKEACDMGVEFQIADTTKFDSERAIQFSFFGYSHDILSWVPSPQKDLRPEQTTLPMVRMRLPNSIPFYRLDEYPPQQLNLFDGRGFAGVCKTLLWWVLECAPFFVKEDSLESSNDKRRRKFRTVFTPNFGKHRIISPKADYHWSVFYRIHHVSNYNPRNIQFNNVAKAGKKWPLGDKFLKLLEPHKAEFQQRGLWREIKSFQVKLNGVEDDSPDGYLDKIKEDNSRFWLYLPIDTFGMVVER